MYVIDVTLYGPAGFVYPPLPNYIFAEAMVNKEVEPIFRLPPSKAGTVKMELVNISPVKPSDWECIACLILKFDERTKQTVITVDAANLTVGAQASGMFNITLNMWNKMG